MARAMRVYVGQPFGALYLGFDLYLALFQIHRQLELGEQGGDDVEVFGAVHLGDHDGVQGVTGLLLPPRSGPCRSKACPGRWPGRGWGVPASRAPVEHETTSPRAAALLSGATASSRSRNTASAAEASAFSAIFRRVAGTARRERAAFMLLVE